MLTEVVNHPAEIRERGANALAYARSELSWDGRVPAFEGAYDRGIERHRWRRANGIDQPAV